MMNKETRVTIKDIAKITNVSPTTVSRYINGNGYVGEKTAMRIADTIQAMNYRTNLVARCLKTKISKNIVLIVQDIQNPFYSQLANAIQKLTIQEDYIITLFNIGDDSEVDREEVVKYLGLAKGIGADGIILVLTSMHPVVLQELERINIPVVMINAFDTCQYDSVRGARRESTYLSTAHLIELGHTKIGFAGGLKGTLTAAERKAEYLDAMMDANIPLRKEFIIEMGFDSDSGRKSGEYFAALADRPTAICCANDIIALGILQIFIQQGIRIPEDISITGMDDVPYADLCSPKLTTVSSDSFEFASKAVAALLERMQGVYTGEPREFLVSRRLIIRESTRRL